MGTLGTILKFIFGLIVTFLVTWLLHDGVKLYYAADGFFIVAIVIFILAGIKWYMDEHS